MVKFEKFPEEERNFETRIKFIKEIFSNKYEQWQIMAQCITHKLDRSYESYLKDLHKSAWQLEGKDPLAVLKQIGKQEILVENIVKNFEDYELNVAFDKIMRYVIGVDEVAQELTNSEKTALR